MNKWLALSQAFASVSCKLEQACENMHETVKAEPRFDALYVGYVVLLEVIKTTMKVLFARFEEIDLEVEA